MSHKLSELGIQHDGFICFNNPNEVVSDKEFEERQIARNNLNEFNDVN